MTDHEFPYAAARRVVQTALDEDLGPDNLDVTTFATIPPEQVTVGHVVARADGVVAGLPAIALVIEAVAARIGALAPRVEVHVSDGTPVTIRP